MIRRKLRESLCICLRRTSSSARRLIVEGTNGLAVLETPFLQAGQVSQSIILRGRVLSLELDSINAFTKQTAAQLAAVVLDRNTKVRRCRHKP